LGIIRGTLKQNKGWKQVHPKWPLYADPSCSSHASVSESFFGNINLRVNIYSFGNILFEGIRYFIYKLPFPICADRIIATHRERPTLGIEAVLEEIEKNKGILYDDNVADVCLRLFREKGFQLT
jgi:hypothetical protein